jgi:hypothetical protein
MQTLGDVVMAGLIFAALIVVPYKIAKAWLWPAIKPLIMSRSEGVRSYPISPSDRHFTAVSSAEINNETGETPRPVEETEREKISFAETAVAEALARLIIAEELDLTKAVKIGAGKKSGEGYQKWSKLIKVAMERLREPEYPALVAQQRPSIVEKS